MLRKEATMIPAIGTMIAAYIVFRMVEILFLTGDRYKNRTAHVVLSIFALIVAVIIFFCWLSLITTGSTTPSPIR